MSRKHDEVIGDVLSGLDEATPKPGTAQGSRFLKRQTALGARGAGDLVEKSHRLIDPAEAIMWERHNRDYKALNEDSCADLIEGLKAQGRQEFPAIVRRLPPGSAATYEVICGARRHWAISWLRANNYPQFKFLIEEREMTDEEAFRLADIENRDREDLSDFERAVDYAEAIDLYYGGKQRAMAARLEVTEAWLSRYLALARLPGDVVTAFPSKSEIKEVHARMLKPGLADPKARERVLRAAHGLSEQQKNNRMNRKPPVEASEVVAKLKAAVKGTRKKTRRAPQPVQVIGDGAKRGVSVLEQAKTTTVEIPHDLDSVELHAALTKLVRKWETGSGMKKP